MAKIKRIMLAHFFEYEYFIESTVKYVIGFVFTLLVFFLSNWINALRIYKEFPSYQGFYILGLSILASTLALLALTTAFLIPRFEEFFQLRGLRKTMSKGREKHISVAVVLVILILVSTSIFLGYYTQSLMRIG